MSIYGFKDQKFFSHIRMNGLISHKYYCKGCWLGLVNDHLRLLGRSFRHGDLKLEKKVSSV